MAILTQIGVVLGVCLVGELVAQVLPFPFPSSVIAMVLLFVLLCAKVIKPHHIRQKGDFLLKNMAFFFIPAGVGILENFDQLKANLLLFLAVCAHHLHHFFCLGHDGTGHDGFAEKRRKIT